MPDDPVTLILGYGIASFLLTAFYVRLRKQSGLAKKIRQHFYWFPVMPPVIIARSSWQGMIWAFRSLFGFLRYCFETLSGKKTYRRQKIGLYYHD